MRLTLFNSHNLDFSPICVIFVKRLGRNQGPADDTTMAIKNRKHSELFRAYQESKRLLTSHEYMLKYLSHEHQMMETPVRAVYPEVARNTEYNHHKEERNEQKRRCAYLKKMINQVQRTYSLNQNH